MCSFKSLLRLHGTEIGVNLFHSELLSDLLMGTTLLLFHLDGNVPVAMLRLSNLVMVFDKTGETPSRPVALFSF